MQIERCFCNLQISRNFQRKTTICERCVCNRCKSLVSENRCNQFEGPALSRHIVFVDVSHLPFSFFFLKVLGLLFRQSEPKGRTIFNKVLFAVHHGPCFRVFWQFRRPYCVGSFCFFWVFVLCPGRPWPPVLSGLSSDSSPFCPLVRLVLRIPQSCCPFLQPCSCSSRPSRPSRSSRPSCSCSSCSSCFPCCSSSSCFSCSSYFSCFSCSYCFSCSSCFSSSSSCFSFFSCYSYSSYFSCSLVLLVLLGVLLFLLVLVLVVAVAVAVVVVVVVVVVVAASAAAEGLVCFHAVQFVSWLLFWIMWAKWEVEYVGKRQI